MNNWLQHMPPSLHDRIARGEISEQEVAQNTERLGQMLDHLLIDKANIPKIRRLLQPPICINPNAAFRHDTRIGNIKLAQGSLLGLTLENECKAEFVEPLLKLGFDRTLFPENRYVLQAAGYMPTPILWLLERYGFDMHEKAKDGTNAFFAAIDANNLDKITVLTQIGVNGNCKATVSFGRGTTVFDPFQYAYMKKPSFGPRPLMALLENGWSGLIYKESKDAVTTIKGEVMNDVYNSTLLMFFKHYQNRAQRLMAQDPSIYNTLSVKDLCAFASIGYLDSVVDPRLWQGREAMLTRLYVQTPPHIQQKMRPLMPLLNIEFMRHRIEAPVAEWSYAMFDPKQKAL